MSKYEQEFHDELPMGLLQSERSRLEAEMIELTSRLDLVNRVISQKSQPALILEYNPETDD
jgi:hypothetical protein